MKTSIFSSVYNLAEFIDQKLGWYEEFEYETAPYCGHHHNGHSGKLTESYYHEGMGGKSVGNDWFRIYEVEGDWNFTSKKKFQLMKWFGMFGISKFEGALALRYPSNFTSETSSIVVVYRNRNKEGKRFFFFKTGV